MTAAAPEPAPLLAAYGLSVRRGARAVVEAVDLTVRRGEIVALLGANGAGKTTLLRALAGLAPHEGRLDWSGAPLRLLSRAARARAIAYLPQGGEAAWPLPARDVVALGRLPHGARAPLTGGDAAAVAAAMQACDVTALADRAATELSGGERARVLLARALAVEADLLLADEPVAALDPGHQLAVMAALAAQARRDRAVLVVTHDVGLALRFCPRIVLMRGGRLVADLPAALALASGALEQAFGVAFVAAEVDGLRLVAPREIP